MNALVRYLNPVHRNPAKLNNFYIEFVKELKKTMKNRKTK